MATVESQVKGNTSIYPVVQPTGHGDRMVEAQRSKRRAMRPPSKSGLNYSSKISDQWVRMAFDIPIVFCHHDQAKNALKADSELIALTSTTFESIEK